MNMSTGLKCIIAGAVAATLPLGAGADRKTITDFGTVVTEARGGEVSKAITIGRDKSIIIELEAAAADVVITNPEIADVIVQTNNRLVFRGVEFGQTNAFVFDEHGNQLLNLEISVEVDTVALHEMINRHMPGSRVKVEGLNGNVMITGMATSLSEADQIQRLVAAYVRVNAADAGAPQVVNMLSVAGKDQVMLEVRIVEMQRNSIKQLGVNLTGAVNFGQYATQIPFDVYGNNPETGLPGLLGQELLPGGDTTLRNRISSSNGFPIQGRGLGGLSLEQSYLNFNGPNAQSSIGAAVDALERIGIVKTLAEPNLTAMSGESANFLAGGEFPVPVAQNQNGEVTIEFKPFGVGLGFTPVVLSEGRISLKISTEVSELTSQGAFQGASTSTISSSGEVLEGEGLTIPALTVRRAESVVELPSGGSMMLAGLIQSKTRQNLDQLPGLKKLPILGALFQSRDFLSEETELVIIVTPYLVDPTQKNQLRSPADGYANASDSRTLFFGKLNDTYGKDGAPIDPDSYRAPVGFIEE